MTFKIKGVIITTILMVAVIQVQVQAQGRILPIMESPSSAKSLSLGSSRMGNIGEAYIYNNPTSIYQQESSRFYVDYSLGVLENENKNHLLHTLTTSYRLKRHALFVGAKYLNMGSMKGGFDTTMQPIENKIDCYTYSLDLGYAYQVNKALSLFANLGYVKERTTLNIEAYHLTIGSYYTGKYQLSTQTGYYNIGILMDNIGSYRYNGESKSLSQNIRLGGSILMPTLINQSIEVFLDGGIYLPASKTKFSSSFSTGVDYSFYKKYSIRLGGHWGDHDDYLSTGFGIKYKRLEFSAGAKIAFHLDLNNIYMVGLKIAL